jgi:hypothetical protein
MQPHSAACMAHSAPAEEDVAERVDAVVELLQEECRPLGSRRATRAQHPRENDEPVLVCEPHRVRSQALPVFRRRAQHRYRLALVIAPVLPFRPLHSPPTVYAVASRRGHCRRACERGWITCDGPGMAGPRSSPALTCKQRFCATTKHTTELQMWTTATRNIKMRICARTPSHFTRHMAAHAVEQHPSQQSSD